VLGRRVHTDGRSIGFGALARLKNRVEPQVSAGVISQIRVSPVTVLLKARINEEGNITSSEMQGGHPFLYSAIREAIDQWRFFPAVTQDGARWMRRN
jgi:hypothetical protein